MTFSSFFKNAIKKNKLPICLRVTTSSGSSLIFYSSPLSSSYSHPSLYTAVT